MSTESPPPPYPLSPPRTREDLPAHGPGAVGPIGPRFVARIIDNLVVSLPLTLPFVKVVNGQPTFDFPTWIGFVLIVAPLLYDFVCVAIWGMTVGKRIVGVKVVRYTDGGRVDPYQAGLRALVPNLPLFLSYLPGLEFVGLLQYAIYLSCVIDPVYRGLHDKAAGTIVLRSR